MLPKETSLRVNILILEAMTVMRIKNIGIYLKCQLETQSSSCYLMAVTNVLLKMHKASPHQAVADLRA